jgi:hypothetical protein
MTGEPAPLDVVRQKLDSRNEEARIAALCHAAAHGGAARALAAKVAYMLDDESPAVQWHAMSTFRDIGRGATDAVTVLLELRAKGEPPMLVSRATACLGIVGPAAGDAVPVLKAALSEHEDEDKRRYALDSLWSIAPGDREVMDFVMRDAFSSDFRRSTDARRLLKRANEPVLLDRAFAEIAVRLQGDDPVSRQAAAQVLSYIAAMRPAVAADLLRELLRDPVAAEVRIVAAAVRELPAPGHPIWSMPLLGWRQAMTSGQQCRRSTYSPNWAGRLRAPKRSFFRPSAGISTPVQCPARQAGPPLLWPPPPKRLPKRVRPSAPWGLF